MKIIFDSEEQKEAFMSDVIEHSCPEEYYLENKHSCSAFSWREHCDLCWANCGIEVEVIEDENNI